MIHLDHFRDLQTIIGTRRLHVHIVHAWCTGIGAIPGGGTGEGPPPPQI